MTVLISVYLQVYDHLDVDGLPFEGERAEKGMALVCFIDDVTGSYK